MTRASLRAHRRMLLMRRLELGVQCRDGAIILRFFDTCTRIYFRVPWYKLHLLLDHDFTKT